MGKVGDMYPVNVSEAFGSLFRHCYRIHLVCILNELSWRFLRLSALRDSLDVVIVVAGIDAGALQNNMIHTILSTNDAVHP